LFYAAQALLLEDKASNSKHSAANADFGERFAKTGRNTDKERGEKVPEGSSLLPRKSSIIEIPIRHGAP